MKLRLGKVTEVFKGSLIIGLLGFFGGRERTQMGAPTVFANLRVKSVAPRIIKHTLDAEFIIWSYKAVTLILGLCRWTQIIPAIITGITIVMIDLWRWLVSCHQSPDNSMSAIIPIVQADSQMTLAIRPRGDTTAESRIPRLVVVVTAEMMTRPDAPAERAEDRIVGETFLKVFSFWENVGLSHSTHSSTLVTVL